MTTCQLDNLPVELIHHLLNYFSAHEIFYSFINVTSYIDAILLTYPTYRINFKSITRSNFDLICQFIQPEQVIALTLSNDDETPGLIDVFLSQFQITQFTHLQSLKLVEIGPEFWEKIVSKLIQLKHLRVFYFFPSNRFYPWICQLSDKIHTELDQKLFLDYTPVLCQLHRLRLCHGSYFKQVDFSQLRHFILEQSTYKLIQYISSVAPQLKSLETSIECSIQDLDVDLFRPSTKLNRLVLKFKGSVVTMNYIERMLANVPYLKHLELIIDCHNDAINGERWQAKVKNLITFNFKLKLSDELNVDLLDSFRTRFWIKEKRWFIAYEYKCLLSVPYFSLTGTTESYGFPRYSTVPDNQIFCDHIKCLHTSEIPYNFKYRFNHIQTLTMWSPVSIFAIEKIICLDSVQELRLWFSIGDFPTKELLNKMTNLQKLELSVKSEITDFFIQMHRMTMNKIRTLVLRTSLENMKSPPIRRLSRIFPNVEHLHIYDVCSPLTILDCLSKFTHLSTASFQYADWIIDDDSTAETSRTNIELALDQACRTQRFNFTYRFDSQCVHLWI